MPVKPETILRRVRSLPEHQSKLYLEFKDWLENEQDNSERNWLNYFKVTKEMLYWQSNLIMMLKNI